MKNFLLSGVYNLIVLLFAGLTAISAWCAEILAPGSTGQAGQYGLAFSLQSWLPQGLLLFKWVIALLCFAAPLFYAVLYGQKKGLDALYRWLFATHGVSVIIILTTLVLPIPNHFGYLSYCLKFLLFYCLPISLISPLFSLYRRKTIWKIAPISKKELVKPAALLMTFQMGYTLLQAQAVSFGAITSQNDFVQLSQLREFIRLYHQATVVGIYCVAWFFFSLFALRKWGLHALIKSIGQSMGLSLVALIPIALYFAGRADYRFADLFLSISRNPLFSDGCLPFLIRSSIMALLSSTAAIATVDGVFGPQTKEPPLDTTEPQ